MIHIQSWKSQIADRICLESESQQYSATFTNQEEHDDRSDWTQKYIKVASEKAINLSYDPSTTTLLIDCDRYNINSLSDYKLPEGKILVDSTSLSLPELLHLFDILDQSKKSFDLIYTQPTKYTANEPTKANIDTVNTFALSDDGIGIQQLPPYIGYSDASRIFFFLGWEGHRLGALINSDEINTRDTTCLVGIPAFKTGWENITLSNNYKQLSELRSNSQLHFRFAGANDPIKTYEAIAKVYQSTNYENKKLFLAPFGTKPATIAAAQFAVNKKNVVILYDFVKKKKKRSSGTDILHQWEFKHS